MARNNRNNAPRSSTRTGGMSPARAKAEAKRAAEKEEAARKAAEKKAAAEARVAAEEEQAWAARSAQVTQMTQRLELREAMAVLGERGRRTQQIRRGVNALANKWGAKRAA